MCEGRICRHGPSVGRKLFNFRLDALAVKEQLRKHDIPYRIIAHRAGIQSPAFVADVLAGRKKSIYVERAVQELLQEAMR